MCLQHHSQFQSESESQTHFQSLTKPENVAQTLPAACLDESAFAIGVLSRRLQCFYDCPIWFWVISYAQFASLICLALEFKGVSGKWQAASGKRPVATARRQLTTARQKFRAVLRISMLTVHHMLATGIEAE